MNTPNIFISEHWKSLKHGSEDVGFLPSRCGDWIFDWLERYKIEQCAVTDEVPSAIAHVGGRILPKAVFSYVFKDK